MPIFVQDAIGIGQDGFTASVTPTQSLGAVGRTRDGRLYRYARAGALDLVAGNLLQSAAFATAHQNLTPVAANAGANQIVATLGAAAATAGQYAEGYASIDTSPGGGYQYQISGHAAVLSGGVITVNTKPEDAIQVALSGVSRVDLLMNPYNGVIVCPIALTGVVVGCATYVIPAGQYGWIQCYGPSPTLVNGTPALGTTVVNGATTPGSVDVITTTNLVTSTIVGSILMVGVSGKFDTVFLRL
jgi:hypothetical protein